MRSSLGTRRGGGPRLSLSILSLLGLAGLVAGALLGACSSDGGTEPPIPKLDQLNLEFGTVAVGDGADRVFVVRNDGGGTVSGTISAECPDFAVVAGAGPFALAAGVELEVTVRFQPSSAGSKSCVVATGNASLGSVRCRGVGVRAAEAGACCAPDGSCTVAMESTCAAPAIWSGADTACEPNPCAQPTGACCAADGTCSVLTEAACPAPSAWLGMDVACAPNPCPQPTGACCAPNGSCAVTTQAACSAPSEWLGTDAACAPNPCPQPTGACCAPNGSCAVTTEAACSAPSEWLGTDAACAPNPCSQPTGACCASNGSCTVMTQVACSAPSEWLGTDAACAPNPCPQPTGACCAPNGSCTVMTQVACSAPSEWLGTDAACAPNPCPQPTGACCAPNGSCTVTTEAACSAPSEWLGTDAACAPNPCPQPTGACCAPDGSCALTTQAACAAPSAWMGVDTDCAPNPCPQPTGACCAPDGSCALTTQAACAAPSAWMGMDSACAPNPCPQPTGACCTPEGSCSVLAEADCAHEWTAFAVCTPNPCAKPTGSCCAADGTCTVTLQAACAGAGVWMAFGACQPNPCPQPAGACCDPSGACAVSTEADCLAPDTWEGAGSSCSPNPCLQPAGACCAPDGSCAMTTEADCAFSWTALLPCAPNPCAQPTGACCAHDGSCTVTFESACTGTGGWTAFAACAPNPCPQPLGACCATSGACALTTEASCPAPGVWQGMDVPCAPNPCPQPTGACCTPAGVCTVTTQAACDAPDAWQGAGTDCAPNPCPPPTGACCAASGACAVTTQADCASPNEWQGVGSDCSPNPCPQPSGACCAADGSCTVTTESGCGPSSVWQGAGTGCSPNPCPPPVGACCAASGACAVTTEAGCAAPNVWQGPATDCSPNPCPQPSGACCAPTGACTLTTQAACTAPKSWQGAGTDCTPNPCPAPTILLSPSSLPDGTVGAWYAQAISASGGSAPYAYAVVSGAPPDGLTLSSAGVLSGTPTAAGTFPFTVRATDANAFTGEQAYAVTIAAESGLDLTVPVAYVTQSTQTQDFDVPLLEDRNGLLRAFAVASGANSETPEVRVRIYDSGDHLVQTYTLSAPGSSVPTAVNEGSLSASWNQVIPGALLQPGYSLLVDVDPDGAVAESNEDNNVWPASGIPWALDVRSLPVLEMTLVPVTTTSGTGNVHAGNAATFLDQTRRMHPIPEYDDQVGAVLASTATLGADGSGWDLMLTEVTARRVADGSSRHYFGVAHVNYTSGVAGIGWIGYPVATGWDHLPSASGILAHEIGHNWDCRHVLCLGGEADPDPGYPYAGGGIGVYGYDLWGSALKSPSTYKDVMSYCNPVWISDYMYKQILGYRESSPFGLRGWGMAAGSGVGSRGSGVGSRGSGIGSRGSGIGNHGGGDWSGAGNAWPGAGGAAPEEPCLLVWGLQRDGRLRLEPSFHITARPSAPSGGPYRVEGVDATGRVVWTQSFDLLRTTHPTDPTSAGFCFAAPMAASLLEEITALRVMRGGAELARREATAGGGGPGGTSAPRAGGPANVADPGAPYARSPIPVSATRRGGNAIELRWDAARSPVAMVRDRADGRCLGFARGGRASVTAANSGLELLFSDGVHTRVERWPAE